jgi:hypothetical protein
MLGVAGALERVRVDAVQIQAVVVRTIALDTDAAAG